MEVTVKFGRELVNVMNMITETSASSSGDKICKVSRCDVIISLFTCTW